MTDIILIRHGETDWNRVRRMQGHLDIGLNAHGHMQAHALAVALAGESVDAIYASDLQRARDTAQAIATAHLLPVTIDPALRERCYGAFEGLMYDEISERYPEAFAQWRAREPDARFPAGERSAETLLEFSMRAVAAVTHLARLHQGGKIIIVTHGGVLDCIYRAAFGMGLFEPREFDMKNAAINRLHWRDSALHVTHWSQVTHLDMAVLDEIDRQA
jgi:probable phosphoglycerate mutase